MTFRARIRRLICWLPGIMAAAVVLWLCLSAAAMLWYLHGQTIYASGFSEVAFGRVRRGMDLAQVTALLGQPLEVEVVRGNERLVLKPAEDLDWLSRVLRPSAKAAGTPQRLDVLASVWLLYSKPDPDGSGSYQMRHIRLGGDGRVAEVICERCLE